jgi:hypothetical protein
MTKQTVCRVEHASCSELCVCLLDTALLQRRLTLPHMQAGRTAARSYQGAAYTQAVCRAAQEAVQHTVWCVTQPATHQMHIVTN